MHQTTLLLKKAWPTLLLFCGLSASAQLPVFTPFVTNKAEQETLQAAIASRYQKDLNALSGPGKKDIAALYKERFEAITKRFAKGEALCADAPQQYLGALGQIIFNANPGLGTGDIRLLFSRSFYANAASLGEGTILFNIGLFHRLQNEAQAAFVICHELAHYYLNHSNQNIATYVATTHSADFQKSLKQIQRSDYQKASQLEALTKSLMFRNRRHSRGFEQAADSMALELFKNTAFDVRESLSCLQLLDSADRDKYDNALALDQRFGFAAFPFKSRWLESGELRFNTTETAKTNAELDSLKTHPDCANRIRILQDRVQQYSKPGGKKFLVSEPLFQNLIGQFDFEIIEYALQAKSVSRALYFSLEMLPQAPDHPYLHAVIGACLNEIYAHQKAHTLSTITDLPNDAYAEKYNTLLHFIQNLRLPEIAALSYNFLKANENHFAADTRFAESLAQSRRNFEPH